MHEEDGQANVEQDNHADHDGVWALENMRKVVSELSELIRGVYPNPLPPSPLAQKLNIQTVVGNNVLVYRVKIPEHFDVLKLKCSARKLDLCVSSGLHFQALINLAPDGRLWPIAGLLKQSAVCQMERRVHVLV